MAARAISSSLRVAQALATSPSSSSNCAASVPACAAHGQCATASRAQQPVYCLHIFKSISCILFSSLPGRLSSIPKKKKLSPFSRFFFRCKAALFNHSIKAMPHFRIQRCCRCVAYLVCRQHRLLQQVGIAIPAGGGPQTRGASVASRHCHRVPRSPRRIPPQGNLPGGYPPTCCSRRHPRSE